jgi:hypothetical protein
MAETSKTQINLDGEQIVPFLKFIADTQEGKYTEKKPILAQITYKRLQIQEQDNFPFIDKDNEGFLLFGIS